MLTMDYITLLLAITTALLLVPYIKKFFKLAESRLKTEEEYDKHIKKLLSEQTLQLHKIKSLDKAIQDILVLLGTENAETSLIEPQPKEDESEIDWYSPLHLYKGKKSKSKKRKITKRQFQKPTRKQVLKQMGISEEQARINKKKNPESFDRAYNNEYKRLYSAKYYIYVTKRKNRKLKKTL